MRNHEVDEARKKAEAAARETAGSPGKLRRPEGNERRPPERQRRSKMPGMLRRPRWSERGRHKGRGAVKTVQFMRQGRKRRRQPERQKR